MATQIRPQAASERPFECIDSIELARRLTVPVSWVREQVRSRAADPLPHLRLGKYVRFLWGSPELDGWIHRRIVLGSNRQAGRVIRKELQ